MKGEHHLAVSLAGAAGIYTASRSAPMSLSFLAFGVLLDLDHWIDYWIEYGARLDVAHFFRAVSRKEFRRAFLFLHAWEGFLLSALLAWWSGWAPLLSGACLGWGSHLLCDQFSTRPNRWGYFLAWRIAGRFDYRHAFPAPYLPPPGSRAETNGRPPTACV